MIVNGLALEVAVPALGLPIFFLLLLLLRLGAGLGLLEAGIVGGALAPEHDAPGLHIQVSFVAEVALVQHVLQIVHHLRLGQAQRGRQVGDEHGVAPGQNGIDPLIPLLPAAPDLGAGQHAAAQQDGQHAGLRAEQGHDDAGHQHGGAEPAHQAGILRPGLGFAQLVQYADHAHGRDRHGQDRPEDPLAVDFKTITVFHIALIPPLFMATL